MREDRAEERTGLAVIGVTDAGSVEVRSIGEHPLASDHMVPRTPVHQRMRSAGIVPEHTADAAAVASRCLRREKQPIRLQGQVQLVTDDARLHPRPTFFGIDFQDLVPPLDIHHNPLPHNLPRQ